MSLPYSQKDLLYRLLGIPYTDQVATQSRAENLKNKTFNETNKFTTEMLQQITSNHTHTKSQITDILSLKFFGFFNSVHSGTSNSNRFYPLNGGNTSVTIENDVANIWDKGITIKRIRYTISGNTKDQNTIVSFRDDASDIHLYTIPAGNNDDYDSGDISIVVASGSRLAWRMDGSLSTIGTIVIYFYMLWEANVF